MDVLREIGPRYLEKARGNNSDWEDFALAPLATDRGAPPASRLGEAMRVLRRGSVRSKLRQTFLVLFMR